MYDVPERSIAAFERIHGLRVAIHDLVGQLWAHMAPERFMHASALCDAAKAYDRGVRCIYLETRVLREQLAQTPDGRFHVCHAGLVEWVVPVFDDTRLAWVIFAGSRMPAPSLSLERLGTPSPDIRWPPRLQLPPQVAIGEAEDILEHLRQLACRLSVWAAEQKSDQRLQSHLYAAGNSPEQQLMERGLLIRRLIALRHKDSFTLGDLASRLSLSESRTSHLVRQTCGATFQDLLTRARLKTAMGLLRTSDMPVADVALYSGFRDIAHFHRVFRRIAGLSPGAYRMRCST